MTEPITLPAPKIDLTPRPRNKWELEYQAFLQLVPQLLPTQRGRYVALHEGQVVDDGDDPIVLIKRVHATHGYVPIHVGLVIEQPPPPIRIPHYRLFRWKEPT